MLTGFSDGFLVALGARDGDVLWARSLAGPAEQFMDVDATPVVIGDTVVGASYGSGLTGLDLRDGRPLWRLGVPGVAGLEAVAGKLYFANSETGLNAMDAQGNILWRQGGGRGGGKNPELWGDVTAPLPVKDYLLVATSKAGLFVAEKAGGALVRAFNPGGGLCSRPVNDSKTGMVFALSNGGRVYALALGSR